MLGACEHCTDCSLRPQKMGVLGLAGSVLYGSAAVAQKSQAQAFRREAALQAQAAAMLRCARALEVDDQRNALHLEDRSRLKVHAWT